MPVKHGKLALRRCLLPSTRFGTLHALAFGAYYCLGRPGVASWGWQGCCKQGRTLVAEGRAAFAVVGGLGVYGVYDLAVFVAALRLRCACATGTDWQPQGSQGRTCVVYRALRDGTVLFVCFLHGRIRNPACKDPYTSQGLQGLQVPVT